MRIAIDKTTVNKIKPKKQKCTVGQYVTQGLTKFISLCREIRSEIIRNDSQDSVLVFIPEESKDLEYRRFDLRVCGKYYTKLC